MPRYTHGTKNRKRLERRTMQYNYIAIEGTVGAGKTSLATRIAKDFNGQLILAEFEGDKNPFLPKFYKEPAS